MKKAISIMLLTLLLLSLFACAEAPQKQEENKEGYIEVLDAACELVKHFDRELMDKVIPPLETEYYTKLYRERKNEDYVEALKSEYAQIAAQYDEVFGEDWKLSYSVISVDERDSEGIEQYKSFDGYYFREYGFDLDAIDAVSFVKANVHIEGSKGSNDKERTLQFFRTGGKWYSFYAPRFGIKMAPQGEEGGAAD